MAGDPWAKRVGKYRWGFGVGVGSLGICMEVFVWPEGESLLGENQNAAVVLRLYIVINYGNAFIHS